MSKKTKSTKINKKILKTSLALTIFILFSSVIILMSSLLNTKKSSLQDLGYTFSKSGNTTPRKFKVESEEESIYNLGEYRVNLNARNYLTFDLSVKCPDESFHTLLENNILIQNAVLDTFSTYGEIYMPNTVSGKERIKKKIKQNIYDAFGHSLIEEVYFNKYLIR